MTHNLMQSNISLIVALSTNGVIGRDGTLPWHISEDLKRFKSLTTGHTVVMGRRTLQSLPRCPLPNRRNIVLTRDKSLAVDGVEVANSVAQVVDMVQGEDEVFIIGGASLYEDFMPTAQHIYATHVVAEIEGDVYFPAIDASCFKIVDRSPMAHDDKSNLDYYYAQYDRC